MKKQTFILVLMILVFSSSWGQKKVKENSKIQLKLSGFVGVETVYDTREVYGTNKEAEILFYPYPEYKDDRGEDLNDFDRLSFYGFSTRLRFTTTPYHIWGGKVSSFVELDFTGLLNGTALAKLRHAAIKFDKNKSSLLVGQYWHPMFVPSCGPSTSSVVGGAMFMAYSRIPQIRYTYRFSDSFRASIVASSQAYPESNIPEFNTHLEYGDSDNLLFGVAGGLKTKRVRTKNSFDRRVDEKITTYHAMAYVKMITNKVEFKLQGFYVQNGKDLMMLGGYGVDLNDSKFDAISKIDERSYIPISTFTTWAEISTRFKSSFNFGIFGGYAKNLGAEKELREATQARGFDFDETSIYPGANGIEKLIRIAPRVVFRKGPLSVALELNQTYAYFGKRENDFTISDSKEMGNTRVQLYVRYFF